MVWKISEILRVPVARSLISSNFGNSDPTLETIGLTYQQDGQDYRAQ
jgi:hypothetical protein